MELNEELRKKSVVCVKKEEKLACHVWFLNLHSRDAEKRIDNWLWWNSLANI